MELSLKEWKKEGWRYHPSLLKGSTYGSKSTASTAVLLLEYITEIYYNTEQ